MRSITQHQYQKFIEFKSIFSLDNAVKPFSQSGIVVSVYSIIRSSFIRWYSTSTVKLLYIRYLQVVPIFLWESGISRYTKEISCLAHAHFGQRNICWFSSKNSSIYKCIFFFFFFFFVCGWCLNLVRTLSNDRSWKKFGISMPLTE